MKGLLAAEIAEQPGAVAAFLAAQTDVARRIVAALPRFSYVLLAARGSSDHAGFYARYVWQMLGGFPVAPAAPSLHTLYGAPPRLDDALVVAISQSGQSPDVVAVVEDAREQGRPTIAITNDPGSPLARAADHVILLGVQEKSIAATKTYSTQLAAVALLGALWSRDERRIQELGRVPDAVAATLALAAEPAQRAAVAMRAVNDLCIVARGTNLATAHELALKAREVVGLHTIPFSAADFRHGSIAVATAGYPVALVAPTGPTYEDMQALARDLAARGARLIVLSDGERAAPVGATLLPLAQGVPEWLSPLTAVLPGQLLTVALAAEKGLDPDNPHGLEQKIVRTR